MRDEQKEARWDRCPRCRRRFEKDSALQRKVLHAEHFEHEGAGREVADEDMRPQNMQRHRTRGEMMDTQEDARNQLADRVDDFLAGGPIISGDAERIVGILLSDVSLLMTALGAKRFEVGFRGSPAFKEFWILKVSDEV